ncbi:MAG TPA: heparinase II/III family protein [Gemmatimonadaceae bacterium]|nr:heparinase II/III family protein [Gemmatimonadaceae bacterium]
MTLPPTRWPSAAATVARTYGVRGLALRTNHELRRALNTFRRKPRRDVGFAPAPRPHAFAVDGAALAAATDHDVAIERADRVAYGEYQAFRWHWRLRPATPEEWHITPIEYVIPSHTPWWQLPLMKMPGVDVKQVWEPARFAWAYDLVRAWVITHDDRYAAGFHDALAAWVEGNPPFRGVHWACGQETTIRAIALLYAEANLASAPSSTQHAMARVAAVLAASGERIGDAIGYALSQRNNHGISEAVGLLVLGARFRGTHPEAVRWASHGKHLLEGLIREQFAEDG